MSYSSGPYIERLVVSAAAIRLRRLNAGAPLLDTHSSGELADVLGAVVPGTARLAGGLGHARVKLSADPAHAGKVANIKSGVIRNVSVGYQIHAVDKREADNGATPVWRVTDWEPFEISAVPVGADPGAQIRSATTDVEVARTRMRMAARASRTRSLKSSRRNQGPPGEGRAHGSPQPVRPACFTSDNHASRRLPGPVESWPRAIGR